MKIKMDALIQVLAHALDMVEIAYLGASTNHGKRIAVLCAAMGRHLGMSEEELSTLVSCALLHDNALTEFLPMWTRKETDSSQIGTHCNIGQRNIELLPLKGNVDGYIKYHHERANGQGPFGMSEGYYPLGAALIAAADMIDVEHHLQRVPPAALPSLRKKIEADIHIRFTGTAGDALLAVLDETLLTSLTIERIVETVRRTVPEWTLEMDDPALIPVSELIARIIDYKSTFTRMHTQQIANRAWVMAEHYGYDQTQKTQLYLAAALHDIGKLGIPSSVLEKPGKLDEAEFKIIQTHIVQTREILNQLAGQEHIIEWASNHHEKLNGKGYPLGKTAAELDFNSRLMACIDVYQAVSEERPYHPRRSHAGTMPILWNMAENGGLDADIVKDMDAVMAQYSDKDVEAPRYV
jgi:HD-GYP domain-containing protein (c-di-GMP phosphodiesterase class II)